MNFKELRLTLSYVEQQGLIDALELYIASAQIHRNASFDTQNYLSTEKAQDIISLLVQDLGDQVTATIQSGRRYSLKEEDKKEKDNG